MNSIKAMKAMKAMNPTQAPAIRARPAGLKNRKGMLLLLVLSVLTTFMMVGALMLVLATRARTSARAFSSAANSAATSSVQTKALLDEALMVLIRGSKSPTMPAAFTESILEDKYGTGTTLSGTATAVTPFTVAGINTNSKALLTGTVVGLPATVTHPCQLNGRVLTLKPSVGDGDRASYRILRATGNPGSFTCHLANMPANRSTILPKKPCDVTINGREFTPEAYDGYDDQNQWLAKIPLVDSSPTTLDSGTGIRPSYASGASAPWSVDNDNDGVADGVWLDGVLPSRPSPLGGTLTFQVSYLVLDLDGRININAHGSSTNIVTGSIGSNDWPTLVSSPAGSPGYASGTTTYRSSYTGTTAIDSMPMGLGYGPADIDASLILSASSASPSSLFLRSPQAASARWTNLISGGGANSVQTAASASQRRPTPKTGFLEGRYNDGAPGVSGTNDPVSRFVEGSVSGTGNSPSDLRGRIKMFTTGTSAPIPTLTLYRPDFNCNSVATPQANAAIDFTRDSTDDPYELRLDADAPRGTSLKTPLTQANPPTDSPFTLAELERVLRQFDADAPSLPPRLAGLLDDYAQRSRMTITTDSWDTPALTGDAMTKVEDFMKTFPNPTFPSPLGGIYTNDALVYSVLSPDISAGLKFDINRPITCPPATSLNASLAKAYCKHLYTLLVALGQPANAATAQWAVNVLDFRDADSTMTRFQYDTDLSNGWSVNNTDVVWGAERPEILITETIAWRNTSSGTTGQLFVVLHHPWEALTINRSGSTAAAETVDIAMAASTNQFPGLNQLDLQKLADNKDPIWRLKFGASGKYVRFDNVGTNIQPNDKPNELSSTHPGSNPAGTNAACKMGPNSYLCVQPASPGEGVSVSGIPSFAVNQGGTLAGGADFMIPTTTGTVSLERLADPTEEYDATKNPYIKVDEANVVVIDRTPVPLPPIAKQQRSKETELQTNPPKKFKSFWKQEWTTVSSNTLGAYPNAEFAWFHWPNRSFISHGELGLIPKESANDMLAKYTPPSAINEVVNGVPLPPTTSLAADPANQLILDATYVPSRFAGTSANIGDSKSTSGLLYLASVIEQYASTLLSKYREPGRINVNTVVSNVGPPEDVNGNGILDSGEDKNGNGTLDPTTITGSDHAVWKTLVGQSSSLSGTTNPFVSATSADNTAASALVAKTFAKMLSLDNANGKAPYYDPSPGTNRTLNPAFGYASAIRLANVGTIRSNVFAVWVTLKVSDSSPGAPADSYRRVFAIVDRSIPVGYSNGENLNARDVIRLQRFLE